MCMYHVIQKRNITLKLLADTAGCTVLLACLLWQKDTVNVGKNTTSSNGHIPKKLHISTKHAVANRSFCENMGHGMTLKTVTLLSSSSLRTASWMCLGTILVFLLSLAALPASSKTSAAKYSSTAACKSWRECCCLKGGPNAIKQCTGDSTYQIDGSASANPFSILAFL